MDFATLKGESEAWIVDLPASVTARTGLFVNEAIKSAAKRHNFRFMESEITPAPVSTAENQRQLVVKPSDWKEARDEPFLLHQDGSTTPIEWAPSESEMNRSYSYQIAQEGNATPADSGEPRYLLENETDIWVYPLPDMLSQWDNGNHRVKVPYWAYPETLTQDTDTNFITENGDWYVIYKSASIAFRFNRDEERADKFDVLAERMWKELERVDKRAQLPDRLTLGVKLGVHAGASRGQRPPRWTN